MFKNKLKAVRTGLNNYRMAMLGGIVDCSGSEAIKSIAYDSGSKTLEVIFTSGGVYQYYDVHSSTVRGFLQAESRGKYLHKNIRSEYEFTRVA